MNRGVRDIRDFWDVSYWDSRIFFHDIYNLLINIFHDKELNPVLFKFIAINFVIIGIKLFKYYIIADLTYITETLKNNSKQFIIVHVKMEDD